jgi:hypothetical protein
MTDFEQAFEKIRFSAEAEVSIREFSNWILTISIGISSLLIFKIEQLKLTEIGFIVYKIIFIISMLNTFIAGVLKFYILNRETRINIKIGLLKKLVFFDKSITSEQDSKWDKILKAYTHEYNKIDKVAQLLNALIYSTIFLILCVGIFFIAVI